MILIQTYNFVQTIWVDGCQKSCIASNGGRIASFQVVEGHQTPHVLTTSQ